MQELFLNKNIPVTERAAALNELFFNRKEPWAAAFWLMLLSSTGLASLGLSENSGARVIGALVVTPLGSPIIALGSAITLG
jgi:uncharacterized membrane protein